MNCRACDTTRRHMVAVREENDALREQIAGLEQDLKRARFGEPWAAPHSWKLKKPENRLLRAFRAHGFVTKAAVVQPAAASRSARVVWLSARTAFWSQCSSGFTAPWVRGCRPVKSDACAGAVHGDGLQQSR